MPTLGPTLETPVRKTNLPEPSQIKEVTPKEQTPQKTTQAKISIRNTNWNNRNFCCKNDKQQTVFNSNSSF